MIKRFLEKLVIVAIVCYFCLWMVDYFICRGLLKMEDYRFQDYSAMLDGGMRNDILIMGNSRGKSHYDTFVIDSLLKTSSYSIGIGGYPLNIQLIKLKLYLTHNEKPHFIIQNVDYMTFKCLSDVKHQHQSEQFFPLIYDLQMRKELRTVGYGILELFVPMYRMKGYQMEIKNGLLEVSHLKHYISRPAYKGFRAEEGRWNGVELEKIESIKVSILDEAKERMNEYLLFCRKNAINVILVNSPMYCGAIEKLDGYKDIQNYFRDVSKEYDIPFLDYTENCTISRDSTNFCESVHMNQIATKEFTQLLCHDIEQFVQH